MAQSTLLIWSARITPWIVAPVSLLENRHDVLRALIPADVYLFGSVNEYTFKSAAALTQRKVEVTVKIVEGRSGSLLFEGAETGVTTHIGTEAAAELSLNIAGKIFRSVKNSLKRLMFSDGEQDKSDVIDMVADVDLLQETGEAIRKLIKRFPPNLCTKRWTSTSSSATECGWSR